MKKTLISIVVICTVITIMGISVFAGTIQTNTGSFNTVYKTFTLYSDDTGFLQFQIYVDDFYSEVTEYISSSSGLGQQVHHVTVRCLNTTDYDLCLNTGYFTITLGTSIDDTSGSSYGLKCHKISTEVANLDGVLLQAFSKLGGAQLDFLWNYSHQRDGNLLIAADSSLVSEFDIITNFYFSGVTISSNNSDIRPAISEKILNSSVTLQNPKASHVLIIDDFSIADSDYNTQQILESFKSNAQGASDLNDKTDNFVDTNETIHNQEQTWYQQNQQAIEDTGLANFQYSQSQQQGLNSIQTLFNRLWIAIGDWSFVYTFTLMLSLVTLILRHQPKHKTVDHYYHKDGG